MVKQCFKNLIFVAVFIIIVLIFIPGWRNFSDVIRMIVGGVGAAVFWAIVNVVFQRTYKRIE